MPGMGIPGWRRAAFGATMVVVVAVIALAIRLIQHPVYSADSPRVRVTVAGGCPQSLGRAVDVSSPGPSWWSELVHSSKLARSGAIGGLVCQYDAAVNVAPPPPLTLQAHSVLSSDQAAAVSLAAFTQSTRHPSGTFHCPPASGGVIIVVLSYQTGADSDIWWNDTGCQNADNGHIEVYFYGEGLSGGDFTGAVEKVFPAAP
jgi:hypothetical protein